MHEHGNRAELGLTNLPHPRNALGMVELHEVQRLIGSARKEGAHLAHESDYRLIVLPAGDHCREDEPARTATAIGTEDETFLPGLVDVDAEARTAIHCSARKTKHPPGCACRSPCGGQ